MKNIAVITFFVFILTVLFMPAQADASQSGKEKLKLSAQFEGGTLYRAGSVKVVDLRGNYRKMGRQLGHLMREDLKSLYQIAITEEYMGKQKFTYDRLRTIAYAFYEVYPQRYKEIFTGMAETSGMTPEQIILLNAVEFFPKINHLSYNCSALVTWGDYTPDGSVVFGRNNDDSPFFKSFAPFVSVTVLRPDDGSYPTAIVNYTGAIYAANGMNSRGVFLELNGGPWEGFYLKRPSIFVSLLTYLQDLSTMELINEAMMSAKANMSSIVTIADKERGYSVECSCNNARCCRGENNGIIAAANHFVNPDWGLSQLDDKKGGDTIKRRNNLLSLGEKFKGKIDEKKMMEIFDTTIEKGGASHPQGTIFQIVAAPAKLNMWIKAPGNFDWTEVDLSKLLVE